MPLRIYCDFRTQKACTTAVVGPPRLVPESYQRRRVLRAGVNLRLVCPVESSPPPPIVTWSKDGQAVHLGWERYRVHGGVLRVRNVDVNDSGVYVCHATNGFGSIDVRYLVYIYGTPHFSLILGRLPQ